MAFSSSFGTGYTVGSSISDKRKAKKDLEGMAKMNSQFIENFLIPNLPDEEKEEMMFKLQSIEDSDDLSLKAKVSGLSQFATGLGNVIVDRKAATQNAALMEAIQQYIGTEAPATPPDITDQVDAPAVDFDMFSQEDIDQAYQKKNNLGSQGPVGVQGPAGPAGAPGPAGPPIEQFTDFSRLEERLKVEPTNQNHKKELAMQGINAFGDAARDPKIEYDAVTGHNYIHWTDTRKGKPERMKVDDFLGLGQVKKHLETSHQDILFKQKQEEVAFRQENADARNRAMQVAQGSSRPYAGRFAELQQGEAPAPTQAPAPVEQQQQAPANIAEINSEVTEAKELFADGPEAEGDVPAALTRRDRAEAMIRNYFERAGSQASLAGLGSLIQTASAIDTFINPAIEEGERLNETHTEKLGLRQALLTDMDELKKAVVNSDGKATGRINTLLINIKKGVGLPIGKQVTDVEQAAYRVANSLIKARSGAAVSAQEMERVMNEIGRMSYADDDYMNMVDGLIEDSTREYDRMLGSYGAMGYFIPESYYRFSGSGSQVSVNKSLQDLGNLLEAKKLLQQTQNN